MPREPRNQVVPRGTLPGTRASHLSFSLSFAPIAYGGPSSPPPFLITIITLHLHHIALPYSFSLSRSARSLAHCTAFNKTPHSFWQTLPPYSIIVFFLSEDSLLSFSLSLFHIRQFRYPSLCFSAFWINQSIWVFVLDFGSVFTIWAGEVHCCFDKVLVFIVIFFNL